MQMSPGHLGLLQEQRCSWRLKRTTGAGRAGGTPRPWRAVKGDVSLRGGHVPEVGLFWRVWVPNLLDVDRTGLKRLRVCQRGDVVGLMVLGGHRQTFSFFLSGWRSVEAPKSSASAFRSSEPCLISSCSLISPF